MFIKATIIPIVPIVPIVPNMMRGNGRRGDMDDLLWSGDGIYRP